MCFPCSLCWEYCWYWPSIIGRSPPTPYNKSMRKRTISSTQDLDLASTREGAALEGTQELHASEIKKRSLRGVFAYLTRTLLLTGVSIVAMLLLGAKLRPEEYGIYGLVVTI